MCEAVPPTAMGGRGGMSRGDRGRATAAGMRMLLPVLEAVVRVVKERRVVMPSVKTEECILKAMGL